MDINEITTSRPVADHSIEQFLMKPEDLAKQAENVGDFLRSKRVFFLGDDDHISPILAHDFDVQPVVYETDDRIRGNLALWFGRLGIHGYDVQFYDAKDMIEKSPLCDAFYINPPYSSRSKGLGIKVWIMRAVEACKPVCDGVLVMPWGDGGIGKAWVHEVQESVDEFLEANGFEVLFVQENISAYEDTTHSGLVSSNVFLRRTDTSKVAHIEIGNLYN